MGDIQRYARDQPQSYTEVVPNRVTSSIVENWFGNIKKDFCGGNCIRLRPAQFIRKAYTNVVGKLGELELRPMKEGIRSGSKGTKNKKQATGRSFEPPTHAMPRPKASKKKDQAIDERSNEKLAKCTGKSKGQRKTQSPRALQKGDWTSLRLKLILYKCILFSTNQDVSGYRKSEQKDLVGHCTVLHMYVYV